MIGESHEMPTPILEYRADVNRHDLRNGVVVLTVLAVSALALESGASLWIAGAEIVGYWRSGEDWELASLAQCVVEGCLVPLALIAIMRLLMLHKTGRWSQPAGMWVVLVGIAAGLDLLLEATAFWFLIDPDDAREIFEWCVMIVLDGLGLVLVVLGLGVLLRKST